VGVELQDKERAFRYLHQQMDAQLRVYEGYSQGELGGGLRKHL
jgi:hypothetical protein